ncbi:hypothetical protein LUZ60_002917 [Juncus effusus]|nr:hypothetical protein LUZ60_002917 [Juncus effusus]
MERIYVAVRARPLSAEDAKSSPWRIDANSIALANQTTRFQFDRIFGEECKTEELYEARTKEIVASAVSGFNGTVFAYGQTSSGKTHTMKGSKTEPGIIPMAINDLFNIIEKDVDREFLLRMSYMEIYNEDINDLLVPEHRKLQVHENIERGIYVAGLKEEIVTCPEQVLRLMEFGESHRHIGETNMNLYSSRSHTIFRMIIESRERVEEGELTDSTDAVRVSVLNMVDLAGSERVAKTGAEGVRFKEGSHINKSLLTLGNVIEKLSEGAKSQGGHVPYRESKLTRILQPALGGNANTAMICNITLAQIHANETKSSLEFASRALKVENCARVNEIMTDAALLKRQRKEIEELREKLKSSHNEHWEEEILNLRNTLLQSECEKERIVLELEEEKKEKAEREQRLIAQAKKIENLSSLVLNSDRDEKTLNLLKIQKKRRLTWCPGALATQLLIEDANASNDSPKHRASSGSALVPFKELKQIEEDESENKENSDENENENENEITLPDAISLLNVTSRRKISSKKSIEAIETEKSSRTNNESNSSPERKTDRLTMRESEAILVIKQLEDQIKLLEMEKSSVQHNLDDVVELATQQNNSFADKYKEMEQEVAKAREEARIAQEKLSSISLVQDIKQEIPNSAPPDEILLEEIQGLELQISQSKNTTDGLLLFVDELFQSFSLLSKDLKSSTNKDLSLFKSKIEEFEILTKSLTEKSNKIESEKGLLQSQLVDQQHEIEKLKSDLENHENSITEVTAQHELEKDELFGEILTIQNENSRLQSANLAKENESLRKELDRIKNKLKETDSKLKNSIQDRNKLESEKAHAAREIKQLTSQRAVLERDMRKNESKLTDLTKHKESAVSIDKNFINEYQNLEFHAIEMENQINSMHETLINTIGEKDEAFSQIEVLNSEIGEISNKLMSAESEIETLQNKLANSAERLREAESLKRNLEVSIDSLNKEKEEMAMQLTDALLEAESEKSTWLTKEKAFFHASEKLKIYDHEIQRLSNDLSEAKRQLELSSEQQRLLNETIEKLTSQNNVLAEEYNKENANKISKGDELKTVQEELDTLIKERDELLLKIKEMSKRMVILDNYKDLECQLKAAKKERDNMSSENEKMSFEAQILRDNYDKMVSQIKSEREKFAATIREGMTCDKEVLKHKMRCRAMQEKLDAYKGRYKELLNDKNKMKEKFDKAAELMKEKLREYATEILRLNKEIEKLSSGN